VAAANEQRVLCHLSFGNSHRLAVAHATAVTTGSRAAERLNSARRRRRSKLARQTAATGNNSSTTTATFAGQLRGAELTWYVMCQLDSKLSTTATTPIAIPPRTASRCKRPDGCGKSFIPQR